MAAKTASAHKIGRSVIEFAGEAGVSRTLIYRLWADGDPTAPKYVLIRGRRVLIEAPGAWLERIADVQRRETRSTRRSRRDAHAGASA